MVAACHLQPRQFAVAVAVVVAAAAAAAAVVVVVVVVVERAPVLLKHPAANHSVSPAWPGSERSQWGFALWHCSWFDSFCC